MSAETVGKFINDVRQRIDYFRDEFELSYAEAIGSLECLKFELLVETTEDDEDFDQEEDESS